MTEINHKKARVPAASTDIRKYQPNHITQKVSLNLTNSVKKSIIIVLKLISMATVNLVFSSMNC